MRLKRLEIWAKSVAAMLCAVLFFRPGRRRRVTQRLKSARRILIFRSDNRVGEALLNTPLLATLKARQPKVAVDVLLHEKVVRVLEGHPDVEKVWALDRRLWFLGPFAPGVRAVRQRNYDLIVHASNWTAPSVSGALWARLMAPRSVVVGHDVWPVRGLQDVNVGLRNDTVSEVRQRVHLLSVLPGPQEVVSLSFRTPRPSPGLDDWWVRTLGNRPYAVVNPGGRLGYRRVPVEVFARVVRTLVQKGMVPVVTWGPGEEPLAGEVARGAEGAILAPETDLDGLAHLMKGALVTVCNNTGPMHLSVAVGTPTFALFLHMPPERWGHFYGPHRMMDLTPAWQHGLSLPDVADANLAEWLLGTRPTLRK